MIRFCGNTILLVDSDKLFIGQLSDALTLHGARCFIAKDFSEAKEILKKFDFDLIIANYYLPDGIIYQLIDWCSDNLKAQPVFTCLGHAVPGDLTLSRKEGIAQFFSKNDPRNIVNGLSKLIFDFEQFRTDINEMLNPTEMLIDFKTSMGNFVARPIEVSEGVLLMDVAETFPKGTYGILKFSLTSEKMKQQFIIPGMIDGQSPDGHIFKIHENHLESWGMFLNFLKMKQLKISDFLKKASGL